MPLEQPGGGTPQKCFDWGGLSWGKDFSGWSDFRAWLIAHGTDVNGWIDAHPAAAKCIGAVKDPAAAPPPPAAPPPVVKQKCFDWGGKSWGDDYPGWKAFKKFLLDNGADPDAWVKAHPAAAKCIGAPAPAPSPPPPKPAPPPAPAPGPAPGGAGPSGGPTPTPAPAGASWTLTNGPWLFVESDPGSFRAGDWTRLDITPDEIGSGIPVWRCPGGLVPNAEGGQEGPVRDWIPGAWGGSGSIAPVTTLGIDAAAFAALGVTSCMVECYLQGQANALAKYGEAFREGWKDAIPVVGVGFSGSNGHFVLSDYADWLKQFGRRFAVYATDPMNDADWQLLAQLVAGAVTPAPAPVAPSKAAPTPSVAAPSFAPGSVLPAVAAQGKVTAGSAVAAIVSGAVGSTTFTAGAGQVAAIVAAASPPPPSGNVTPEGKHYCFPWGGEYWGGDFPGWGAFWTWLTDRGADPQQWIDSHPDAARCIGAVAVEASGGAGATWENLWLAAGGWPDTLNNVQFFGDWQRFESGGSPHWPGDNNPFNMGTGPPGGEGASGSWHSSGVGATDIAIFPSPAAGAKGTAERIKGGRYRHIDAALKSGYGADQQPALIEQDLRVWGSTSFADYLAKKYASGGGGTPVTGPTAPPPVAAPSGGKTAPKGLDSSWKTLLDVFKTEFPKQRATRHALLANPKELFR